MQRSTSDIDLNLYNGADRMVNNQESLKDDKKKRGRSPFRLVCAPCYENCHYLHELVLLSHHDVHMN
jgi:hypothetical protein